MLRFRFFAFVITLTILFLHFVFLRYHASNCDYLELLNTSSSSRFFFFLLLQFSFYFAVFCLVTSVTRDYLLLPRTGLLANLSVRHGRIARVIRQAWRHVLAAAPAAPALSSVPSWKQNFGGSRGDEFRTLKDRTVQAVVPEVKLNCTYQSLSRPPFVLFCFLLKVKYLSSFEGDYFRTWKDRIA